MALYLAHWDEPLDHPRSKPQHYLGCTNKPVEERWEEHVNDRNRAARIVVAAVAQGRDPRIVRVWPDLGYADEKRLKKVAKRGFKRLCPACTVNPEDIHELR